MLDRPKPTSNDSVGGVNRVGKAGCQGVALLAIFVGVLLMQPHLLPSNMFDATPKSPPPIARKFFLKKEGASTTLAGDSSVVTRKFFVSREAPSAYARSPAAESDSKTRSDAPLWYHISPGSTGSRTLYHASCIAGFPSVHHKSFCISANKGVGDVDPAVVRGARAHTEVLRLYMLANKCIRDRGRYKTPELEKLCDMPLDEWAEDLRGRLRDVIGSGIVGLFDTPYPLLAPQVLELAEDLRADAIVAMTERDPAGWARSRGRNHPLLLCREEYSEGRAGESEFDVLGCVDRARVNSSEMLRFWDVFRYRNKNETGDLETFLSGMEHQMERHQEQYRPLARYAPDMFGNKSRPVTEEDVIRDMRGYIFGLNDPKKGTRGGESLAGIWPAWKDRYAEPLTCRGGFGWTSENDTLYDFYKVSRKSCVASFEERNTKSDFHTIPLILD
ncbi:hypothetical protein ACHAWF_002630 [Thalassiosira exigua]